MRILFWGTPDFALPSLRALGRAGHRIAGVVTRPDRPAGRGRKVRPSPVKEEALAQGYRTLAPERPGGEVFAGEIRRLEPEISVVVAYGRILGREILDLPPRGSVNLHASLLPELRGAAPVNWAILRGYRATGVTVMRMVEEMDAGPILLRAEEPVGERQTASELAVRLAEVGAGALVEALALVQRGASEEREQDGTRATFAPKIGRDDARIDWGAGAVAISHLIRGMDAVPGSWTLFGDRPVKLFGPVPEEDFAHDRPAGTVLAASAAEGLVVAAGRGAVRIGEAQPSGRRRMTAAQWISGRGVSEGERFE